MTPELRIEMAEYANSRVAPGITVAQLRKSERHLGFALPDLLNEIYTKVGNGGFGPGYGLLGVFGGAADDLGRTAIDVYSDCREFAPDTWPEKFLPVCHEGCNHYICIDCRWKSAPVYAFDTTAHFVDKMSWAESTRRTADSLREWLSDWANSQLR